MDDMKIKLVLVGPAKVGKTRVANYLAEFEENPNFETYNPTVRRNRRVSCAAARPRAVAQSLAHGQYSALALAAPCGVAAAASHLRSGTAADARPLPPCRLGCGYWSLSVT